MPPVGYMEGFRLLAEIPRGKHRVWSIEIKAYGAKRMENIYQNP